MFWSMNLEIKKKLDELSNKFGIIVYKQNKINLMMLKILLIV